MEWRELEDLWEALTRTQSRVYHPPTNLYETEEEFVVMMAVSCADKSSLKVTYRSGVLLIQGLRVEPERDVPKRYHLMEIHYGPFQRKIIINAEINPEGIRSNYSDGLLVIHIPKSKPLDIDVEVE